MTSVYDGDSRVKVQLRISLARDYTWSGSVRSRLGVDTPEIRGKCPEEKKLMLTLPPASSSRSLLSIRPGHRDKLFTTVC